MNTVINGKEIKLVTRNEVSAIVSQKVSEMLTRGFVLYFQGGSQGEDGKVCLTNDGGKTVYVFWIHTEFETLDEKCWNREKVLYITAKKYTDVYPEKTLWFKEGELFFEQKWFKMNCKKERYVENIEDWKTINSINSERTHLRYEMWDNSDRVKLPSSVNKVALKIIKNKKGYKSVSLKDIESVVHLRNSYIFNFTKESGKQNFSISVEK